MNSTAADSANGPDPLALGADDLLLKTFGPREVAAILGLSPARIYKMRKDAKPASNAPPPQVDPQTNPFRGGEDATLGDIKVVTAAQERLLIARGIAQASSDPVLVVNCTGIVMASNGALERLLYRSYSCLVG